MRGILFLNNVNKYSQFAVLPLRVALGVVFIAHGGQKLFVYGIEGVAGLFSQLGIYPPYFWAVVVTLVEFLGGIAVLTGFLTRWASLLLAINMLVAMIKVHLPNGFFLDFQDGKHGIEFTFTLLLISISLFISGGGMLSIDKYLNKG